MQDNVNKPIFVVGSPRSGTSILTWCLGQHPNIFPVPESNWLGQFAINVQISYEIGSARADRSLLSGMDIGREEFFANFGRSISDLILTHRKDLERKRKMTRPSPDPKGRWVDQTPEYSFHICALRKLFPEAVFVHIVRDVTDVVRSMLTFHRVSGIQLVASEQEAYNYWLRAVSSCLDAERAYGSRIVHRLRYSDLVTSPEPTLRAILDFLGEPYAAACLNPLQKRINSSNVPVDFQPQDAATDQVLVAKARSLSTELEQVPQHNEASSEIASKMEAEFNQRVQYAAQTSSEYKKVQQIISELRKQVQGHPCEP
jgi:sulfotransferase family protein